MTTTILTPPCPVEWCAKAGHHRPGAGHGGCRIHEKVTSGKLPTSRGGDRWATVAAVVFDDPDEGLTRSVEIADDPEMHNWDEVEQVITALREAARLAFGEADTPRAE